MNPPSVCIVGSGWRFTSGISYYTWHLSRTLARHRPTSVILARRLIPRRWYPGRARVGVRLHALDYDTGIPVYDGLDWYAVPSLFRAAGFIRRQRPDVVVFEWWTAATLHHYALLARWARRQGARIVVEFHEVQDTGESRIRGVGAYAARVGGRFLRSADGYVVHSEHDRRAVRERFRLTGPMRVVPHGPFDHDVSDMAAPGSATGDNDGALRLLFFGTIRPYKGLEHLIEAFDTLSDETARRMTLCVAGETWEGWTEPLEMIAHSRHRDRIELINRYLDDAEVREVFGRADVAVLPYTRSSASGPLHLAMAHGLRVVLTDVGGLRDGAEGYEGIEWVAPADVPALQRTLLRLLDLPRERFEDPRSWEDTARCFDELIRDVIG